MLWLRVLLSGGSFGIWPIIMKLGGANGTTIPIAVTIGTALMCIPLVPSALQSPQPLRTWIFALVAGLVNAFGFYHYGKLISSGSELSIALPLCSALLPLVAATSAILVLGEPITTRKVVGGLVICLGIFIINSK